VSVKTTLVVAAIFVALLLLGGSGIGSAPADGYCGPESCG
jgi:hypothetical protein